MSRAPWGKAKNQVYALREDIVDLLREGNTLESAYTLLSSQNKIDMKERTFRRHATMFRQEALSPAPQTHLDQYKKQLSPDRLPSSVSGNTPPSKINNSVPVKKDAATTHKAPPAKDSAYEPMPPTLSANNQPSQNSSPKKPGAFGHQADGATEDFLNEAYGINPETNPQTDE